MSSGPSGPALLKNPPALTVVASRPRRLSQDCSAARACCLGCRIWSFLVGRLAERAVADAGELQELRAGDGGGGQDDFAPCGKALALSVDEHVDAAGAALFVEQDAFGQRPGFDGQV